MVEGLAVGATWRAWSLSNARDGRTARWRALTLVGGLAVVPGVLPRGRRRPSPSGPRPHFLRGPTGGTCSGSTATSAAMARNPDSADPDRLGPRRPPPRQARADFGDPWLFRVLAETGQVDLKVMRDRVDSQYYDLIVTTSELERPAYDSYDFGLPMPLVERARARYVRIGTRAGLFLYARRPASPPH